MDCYTTSMTTLPPVSIMYPALVKRDSTFEGVFFVGVKTTGVFCRPTCPARKPKPENVEYFSSPQEALYAGYRPCSRCGPLDKEKKIPVLVKHLCEEMEHSTNKKITSTELRCMGIDPSTARRQFQRTYGMSFNAFQRAHRMGLALHDIRLGEPVIMAQLKNGFTSASGFWEAFRQVFGTTPSQTDQICCLQARWIETPIGAMLALANQEGLFLLEFVDRQGLDSEILMLRKRTKCVIVPGNNPHLEKVAVDVKMYFDGNPTTFTSPLVMTGSEFQRSVWLMLRTIPTGKTWSYAKLAQRLGRPDATRAVGNANGRNCLALVIPCHRVIRADGSMGGYAGGVWRKQWLLEHEKRIIEKCNSAPGG